MKYRYSILGLLGVALWSSAGFTQPTRTNPVPPDRNAQPIMIDFDTVDASRKPVSGEPLAKYLATYGMTLADVSPGSRVEIADVRTLYGGKAAKAPSGANVFTQTGSVKGVAFTLRFKQPAEKVVFTRAGLIPSESGITHPFWRAVALDREGKTVDRVLEWVIASFKEVRPMMYTLNGPGIVAVRFESDAVDFTAFSGVLLDDLTVYPEGALSAEPLHHYLAPGGQLTHKLVLRDSGGFAGRGTGRRWELEPDGAWHRIAVENGKFVESRGQLSREQLKHLATELARYELLRLPREVNKMTIADGYNVLIEFGDKRSVFFGKSGFKDLPPADDKTAVGRLAGIAAAIQRALQPPPRTLKGQSAP